MSFHKIFQDERIRTGLATFSSSYAKRMLEGNYDRLIDTAAGRKLSALSRPAKLGIEAALNLLAAYISTHEAKLGSDVWGKIAYEVVMDAPSEIAKRLLNGQESHRGNANGSPGTIPPAEQAAWEELRQLEPETLGPLLSWWRSADTAERQRLAEYLASPAEGQRPTPLSHPHESTDAPTSQPQESPRAAQPKSPSLLSDLTKAMSGLNDKLERRKTKSPLQEGGP